ncbi:MAG: hypothetical protein HYV63_03615, partial [Candidatus Schekmanbacteria bacterium]|nr:hypothetical protein [Candidatus Schekmanbacteria bacterium]
MAFEDLKKLLREERLRRGITLDEVARRGGWTHESLPRKVEAEDTNT